MAGLVSFWQRMSNVFRPEAGTVDDYGSDRAFESAPLPPDRTAAPLQVTTAAAQVPWWRRSSRTGQAGEIALHVTQLAEAMQQHFRQQDQRAAELAGSLDRVGGILEQLAQTQRGQNDYLRTIAEQTAESSKNAAALTATVSRVPESLLAQADAIRTVARQLEVAQETDAQLMHSLQHFGRAVDTLGSSGTAQVEVLQRLNTAQQQQHDAFTALVREQGRRFTVVFAAVAILAVIAIAALAIPLVLRLIR